MPNYKNPLAAKKDKPKVKIYNMTAKRFYPMIVYGKSNSYREKKLWRIPMASIFVDERKVKWLNLNKAIVLH